MKNIILFALLALIALILSGCTQNSSICGDGICSSEETDPNSSYFCTNDCGKEINQKVLENGKCYQDSDCIEGAICCGGQCLKTHNSDGTKIADCCAKKIPYILKTTFGEWSWIERQCCEKVPIVLEQKWENGRAPFVCCNTSECPLGGALYCTDPGFGPEQLLYYSCENYTCVVHQKTPAPEDFACDCSSGTCKIV